MNAFIRKFALLSSLVAVLPVAGCSSDEDSGPSEAQIQQEQDTFAQSYAQAFCAAAARCCTAAAHNPTDACYEQKLAQLRGGFAEIRAAGGTLDATQSANCLQFLNAATGCTLPDGQLEQMLLACDFSVHGQKATGQACTMDQECALPPVSTPFCSGVCGAAEHGLPAGEACTLQGASDSPNLRTCASGLHCNNGICAIPTCSFGSPAITCDDGIPCTCPEPLNENGQCPTAGICVPLAERSNCTADAGCVEGTRCFNGLCTAIANVGDPCADRPCAKDAYCDAANITCAAKKQTGEQCAHGMECVSETCGYRGDEVNPDGSVNPEVIRCVDVPAFPFANDSWCSDAVALTTVD